LSIDEQHYSITTEMAISNMNYNISDVPFNFIILRIFWRSARVTWGKVWDCTKSIRWSRII